LTTLKNCIYSLSGVPCQHVSRAVDVTSVKKAVTQSVWSVCSECLKERVMCDGEPSGPFDVLLCLKCGFQGCNQSDGQHSVKHFQAAHSEPHCIVISLSTWKVWCHECNEELSTHCNKKALAQMVDFLQKHSAKAPSGSSSKIIKIRGETESSDLIKGRIPVSSTLVPVKGLSNLGNTCFFNAVMQNLAQTHLMNDLITEIKEKGSKLKICPSAETNLDPLVVTLPSPEPLTSAMFLFLHSMKEAGKGPISPKILFNQMCQKAPRFKGYQQQDSQELLHYLLDAMRVEETKRIKAGILKAFNNPTEKTADDDTKRQVKAYGKEGVKMNFVDRIFVGELTNTIMCEECEHISTVKEAFIDLSLPIIEERVRTNSALIVYDHSEISDGSNLDSSNDADSEASESESHSRQTVNNSCSDAVSSENYISVKSDSGHNKNKDLNHSDTFTTKEQSDITLGSKDLVKEKPVVSQNPQIAFQSLSSTYVPCAKECSIQSCLYQFTSVELLMGNNKLLCENCTEKKTKASKKDIYFCARKQMLISALPPVVILHLKRFHQAGMTLRKVNRHVDFPLVLDLAPFCSASCKNIVAGEKVLYSLYGIVEHSGSMRGGHYTAYVKIRAPPKKQDYRKHVMGKLSVLLSLKEATGGLPGQWVYVSDTHVQAVPESRVLNSQAYLLFYEELL
uniref:Ubiquitin carboxyl-terminal hydrolase n=1 Tax=Erpetoichthys calabaricus TaxID=27687 RepID=A0A8C4RSF2_ERPCA